jgi:hypothetical protein
MPWKPGFSRRTLLGATAGACAAGALAAWRWLYEAGGPARWPEIEATVPGPVTDATVAALVTASGTIIGRRIEPLHYAEYFRWRAEHLPGYRTLYERFASEVDRAARRTAGCPFADCSESVRVRMLSAARRARSPRGVTDAVWMAVGGRTWAAYNFFIFDEALALFAETDAWVLLGYEGWPGEPRGLDRYRRAPR